MHGSKSAEHCQKKYKELQRERVREKRDSSVYKQPEEDAWKRQKSFIFLTVSVPSSRCELSSDRDRCDWLWNVLVGDEKCILGWIRVKMGVCLNCVLVWHPSPFLYAVANGILMLGVTWGN